MDAAREISAGNGLERVTVNIIVVDREVTPYADIILITGISVDDRYNRNAVFRLIKILRQLFSNVFIYFSLDAASSASSAASSTSSDIDPSASSSVLLQPAIAKMSISTMISALTFNKFFFIIRFTPSLKKIEIHYTLSFIKEKSLSPLNADRP